ncbi:hypothetical protein [Luteimonas aquatica]|uniref:hypothetical protein n=1 Tax=Luteimonas aquatica TaxID=450364 RepID=UPI001F57D9CB|nr:hypothetical protein [Luteimonas aquatica]
MMSRRGRRRHRAIRAPAPGRREGRERKPAHRRRCASAISRLRDVPTVDPEAAVAVARPANHDPRRDLASPQGRHHAASRLRTSRYGDVFAAKLDAASPGIEMPCAVPYARRSARMVQHAQCMSIDMKRLVRQAHARCCVQFLLIRFDGRGKTENRVFWPEYACFSM